MSKRVISFELSPDSISNAIRELEKFKKDLIEACNELIRQLTNIGRDTALQYIALWTDGWTGQLEDSLMQESKFDEAHRTGIIKTSCPYAAYVEFGTGVMGDENPHPEASALGWRYDINQHGDDGWWYYNPNDSHFHWTKGQPAKPFMWYSMIEVSYSVPNVTVKVFAGL